MTLRTKELNSGSDLEEYSQQLLRQSSQNVSSFDLSGEKALFTLSHPALIRVAQIYKSDPTQLSFKNNSYGRYFQTFKNRQEAQLQWPHLKVYEGFPKDIYQFLKESPVVAIIDFQQLGTILIQSSQPAVSNVHTLTIQDYTMSAWLDYALSPELWGAAGKWTRFHDRLHVFFTQRNLLSGQDQPGHYPLKKTTQWIKDRGFYGKENGDAFTLTFPWDFPLSGLVKLENVLAQEP